jgi:hypothetical protein
MGVDVRRCHCRNPPRLWFEWSRTLYRCGHSVTFALLFRFILRRSGNLAVAAFLTLLAAAAAQVHMLARPHVLSWLLTLLWVENLCRFEDGERWALLWLPPLMLLWVNLHAGFILGLGLLGIFAVGRIWSALTAPRRGIAKR